MWRLGPGVGLAEPLGDLCNSSPHAAPGLSARLGLADLLR